MSEQEWVVCSVIEFDDGDPPSIMVLHRGTREDCDVIAEMVDAVIYEGTRSSITASFVGITESENIVEEEVE